MWLVLCQSSANTLCYKKPSCCLGVHCELLSVLRRLQSTAMGALTVSLWCEQNFPVCDLGRWTLMMEGERDSRRWRLAKCFEKVEKLDKQNISLALWAWLLSWSGIFFLCMKPWCRGLQRDVKGSAAISIAWIRRKEELLKWKWWGLECMGRKWGEGSEPAKAIFSLSLLSSRCKPGQTWETSACPTECRRFRGGERAEFAKTQGVC